MFIPGSIPICKVWCVWCVSVVRHHFSCPIKFLFSGDLRISMGGLLVWGMVADLTHGFVDGRFSDTLPKVSEMRGVGNQVFLMSWTRPRNF